MCACVMSGLSGLGGQASHLGVVRFCLQKPWLGRPLGSGEVSSFKPSANPLNLAMYASVEPTLCNNVPMNWWVFFLILVG